MNNSDMIVAGVIIVGILIGFLVAKWLLKLLGSILITGGLVILLAFLTTFSSFNSATNDIFVDSQILGQIKIFLLQDSTEYAYSSDY